MLLLHLTVQVFVVGPKVVVVQLAGAGQHLITDDHHALLNVLQSTKAQHWSGWPGVQIAAHVTGHKDVLWVPAGPAGVALPIYSAIYTPGVEV